LERALLHDGLLRLLEREQTAEADADEAACLVPFRLRELELGVLDGHGRRAERELDEAVHFLELLLLHEARRLPVLHLAREADAEGRAVEERDRSDPTLACKQRFPGLLTTNADGSNEANSGNDDAFHLEPIARGDADVALTGGGSLLSVLLDVIDRVLDG